ncbi:hypothetical protein EH240_25775 [Mesorhizobium tamadayense]|uniref:DUF115 domain-containing protein n=1 Tax=Mesorhizobium tamadayense TaxID=425306 RepID=A0A3P3F8I4_9HYPH|nr:hypothetical protein [Mesorhizobium tamadayense]RRH94950.1 hypothetical protein EH240_25775 [Mesorhizobium tamadayense]
MDASPRVTLLIGSAPDVMRCAAWPKHAFAGIVAINNAWRVRPDWDALVHAGDFPPDRMPQPGPSRQIFSAADYVPAQNTFGGFVYAGGTMSMTAAYWAVHSRRPDVLAFLGCDMIYDRPGNSHFYGTGRADPLRDDITLQSLEAKSARLLIHALRRGTLCVNLSDLPRSRLVFPKLTFEDVRNLSLSRLTAMRAELRAGIDIGAVEAAEALEREFGYFYEDGMYWNHLDEIDGAKLARVDRLWIVAVADLVAPPLQECNAAE